LQILDRKACAAEAYVAQRQWERIVLCSCPFHPEGGCGLERLGSYPRVQPAGARVARFWCPRERASVSVLPAFLAARLVGTLDDVEAVVDAVAAAGSVAQAAEGLHPADAPEPLSYEAAIAKVGRRVRAVRAVLLAAITLLPERFAGLVPTLAAFRERLGVSRVLVTLRALSEPIIAALPVPLGVRRRSSRHEEA
jgi:hypothetical protein